MLHALALRKMQGRWWKEVGLQEGKGNGFELRRGQKPSAFVGTLPYPGPAIDHGMYSCVGVCVKEISAT